MRRAFVIFALSWLPLPAWCQETNSQIMEFTGIVTSIEPGAQFAFSRILITVNGEVENFVFNPAYGKLLLSKIKVGDQVSVKANINLRSRKLYKEMSATNKSLSWFINHDPIVEIKTGNEWTAINYPEIKSSKTNGSPVAYKVFLDKKIVGKYYSDGVAKGVVFENGLVGYNFWLNKYFPAELTEDSSDSVSFIGYRMKPQDGYQYPVEGVRQVYTFSKLNREAARMKSFLFKQNHTCIGVKFETTDGKELKLSFPSEKAIEIKEFLDVEQNVKVYFGRDYTTGRFNNLPELHALVQGKDTLTIDEFGFYGGADGKHEHTPVEFEGKITSLSKTPKGNIESIIVGSEFYIEFDAMMAQQFGHKLEKGKKIIIQGQERVKKIGEIYSKNYRIVLPKTVTFDGTTFSAYQP